jgi:thymidylate synthase (FAD)
VSNGYVQLVDKMGGDLSIVNSARVSYGRVSTRLDSRDIGVLNYMMREKHGSPFEAAIVQFRIRCTIKEAREWFRHRWSSFNEHSSRYSPRIDDVYIPEGSAVRTQVGKPGHYRMETITDEGKIHDIQAEFVAMYTDMERHYDKLLELGAAQELASFAYNLGQMTEFIWTVNARSLCNFMSLRMGETAFLEIRRKAFKVHDFARDVIPVTIQKWNEHRRPDMVTDWSDDDLVWLPEDLR